MTTAEELSTRLGRQVGVRWRRPGPPVGRARPAQVGSLSQASARFARGIGRPVMVRRALAGPAAAAAASSRDLQVRPPRWWAESSVFAGERDTVDYDFSAPRVQRAVRPMAQGTPQRPDGTLAARAPQVVPMRLPADVRAVGRITSDADTRDRRVPSPRSGQAREPGPNTGAGPASAPDSSGGQSLAHDPTTAPHRATTVGAHRSDRTSAHADGATTGSATAGSTRTVSPPAAPVSWASRLVRRRARVAAETKDRSRTTRAVEPATAADPGRTAAAARLTPFDSPTHAEVLAEASAAAPDAAVHSRLSASTPSPDTASPESGPRPSPGATLTRLWSGVPHRIRRAAATLVASADTPRMAAGPTTELAGVPGPGPIAPPPTAGAAPLSSAADPGRRIRRSLAPGWVAASSPAADSPRALRRRPDPTGRPAEPTPPEVELAAGSSSSTSPQSSQVLPPLTAAATPPPSSGLSTVATSSGPAPVAAHAWRRASPGPAVIARRASALTGSVAAQAGPALPSATTGTAPGPATVPLAGAIVARHTTSTTAASPSPTAVRPAAAARLAAEPTAGTHALSPTAPTAPTAPSPASASPARRATAEREPVDVMSAEGAATPAVVGRRVAPRTPSSPGPVPVVGRGSAPPEAPVARLAPTQRGRRIVSAPRDAQATRPAAMPVSLSTVAAAPPAGVPIRRIAVDDRQERAALASTVARAPGSGRPAARRSPVSGRTPAAGRSVRTSQRVGVERWYEQAAQPSAAAPAAGGLPVAPPRTVVRRADDRLPPTPGSRSGAPPVPAAASLTATGLTAEAVVAAVTARTRRAATGAADSSPVIGRLLDRPRPPGGPMIPTTTERGVRIDSVATEVVESGDGSDSAWDEPAITAVVRRVLDEELRDRVNSVVDERLAAETDRRRWRHDRGVF